MKRFLNKSEIINGIDWETPTNTEIKDLKEAALIDFLDCFPDEFWDAVLELINLKVGDCSFEDTPAIEESLRIWVKKRLEKIIESLAYEAKHSHEFKDILSEEKEKFQSLALENTEF